MRGRRALAGMITPLAATLALSLAPDDAYA
jgi:hypothetical protein